MDLEVQEFKMKIWVIIKSAIQQHGEYTMATTERAFKEKADAEAHIKSVPVAWTETKDGPSCIIVSVQSTKQNSIKEKNESTNNAT